MSCGVNATRVAALLVSCLMFVTPSSVRAQHAPQRIAPEHPIHPAGPLANEVQEERHTRRGAVIGALIGGAGGLAFGTLLGLFCEAESDGCWAAVPLLGLAGAAGGALIGGILGATVPRDGGEPSAPDEHPDDATEPSSRTGSFAVAAGLSGVDITNTTEASGVALRATLSAELRPSLAIGLEAGQSFLGDAGDVRHAAVAVRATWPRARVSPYLNGNLGYYDMTAPSLEFFGGSLGLGARVLPEAESGWFIDVEARHSRNLQNIEPLRMNTLLAGIGLYW